MPTPAFGRGGITESLMPEISVSDSFDDSESADSEISGISVSFTAPMFSISVAASEVFVVSAPSVLSATSVAFSAFAKTSAASANLALLVFSAFFKNSEVFVVSGTSLTSESATVTFSTSLSLISGFLMYVFLQAMLPV